MKQRPRPTTFGRWKWMQASGSNREHRNSRQYYHVEIPIYPICSQRPPPSHEMKIFDPSFCLIVPSSFSRSAPSNVPVAKIESPITALVHTGLALITTSRISLADRYPACWKDVCRPSAKLIGRPQCVHSLNFRRKRHHRARCPCRNVECT
jgi:hypothetical protein